MSHLGATDEHEKRRYRRWTQEDADRWRSSFQAGRSIVDIAAAEQVDPKLVSQRLRRAGVAVYQGRHKVKQRPLKMPAELIELLSQGPDYVLKFLDERVWGLTPTESGIEQLRKFCMFIELYKQGKGVGEIADRAQVHRTTVPEWRKFTSQPYLVRAAHAALRNKISVDEKLLPLHLDSGGNQQDSWIRVPTRIASFSDVKSVVDQLTPVPRTYEIGLQFGLSESQTQSLRLELFGYLLGMMVGDLTKSGGPLSRFASMNIDLQLTTKHESNENFGDFVCLATSSLGIQMRRIRDKQPTGETLRGEEPAPAFRWSSERSPLLAWMFSVCLGLKWTELTSYNPVRMDWIFESQFGFRKRFVQGVADSDGRVGSYVVEIVSVPNAEFFERLLHTLDLPSAYTRFEYGQPLRTVVRAREAAELPIFNEIAKGYRYELLMTYKRK
jgi:hypothetical protein